LYITVEKQKSNRKDNADLRAFFFHWCFCHRSMPGLLVKARTSQNSSILHKERMVFRSCQRPALPSSSSRPRPHVDTIWRAQHFLSYTFQVRNETDVQTNGRRQNKIYLRQDRFCHSYFRCAIRCRLIKKVVERDQRKSGMIYCRPSEPKETDHLESRPTTFHSGSSGGSDDLNDLNKARHKDDTCGRAFFTDRSVQLSSTQARSIFPSGSGPQ
jgi:hypothetical protein